VLNDFKTSVVTTDSLAPYNAVVLAAYNYYQFGMPQPGMYAEGDTTYLFGFNCMMWMNQVKFPVLRWEYIWV